MAYVPGYRHDLFISYAHGDDREWIDRFVDRLEPALTQRLGFKPTIWIDEDDLRRWRDFSREIPDAVQASAVFVFLASPTYIRSRYCVEERVPGVRRASCRAAASSSAPTSRTICLRCGA